MFFINRLHFSVILILFVEKFYYFYGAKSRIFKGLRVFDGQEANPSEFPYIIAIGLKATGSELKKPNVLCSGSIIAPVWTLTAGHCIPNIQKYLRSSANKSSTQNKPVIRYFSSSSWAFSNITQAIIHPGYKETSFKGFINHDIGLLQTEETTTALLGKISPVPIATLYGHKVIAAGYGLMNPNIEPGMFLNRSLQMLEAIAVSCKNFEIIFVVRPSFCLAWSCRKPTKVCGGDSGGPVLHSSGIAGIITGGFNKRCNVNIDKITNSSGWITPISGYIDWIANHIQEK